MRYLYLGDRLTAPALVGMPCDPVKNRRGKCICGRLGTMLVIDTHGVRHVVLRRRLRVIDRKEDQDGTRLEDRMDSRDF